MWLRATFIVRITALNNARTQIRKVVPRNTGMWRREMRRRRWGTSNLEFVMPVPNSSAYFTRKQAAEYIVSHEITIDRLIRDGKLPAVKLSKRFIRIKRTDLDKLIERNTVGGAAI